METTDSHGRDVMEQGFREDRFQECGTGVGFPDK